MKKSIEGYLEWNWGETLVYQSEESWNQGNPYSKDVSKLFDFTEGFANKKVKITIEEIE
jgi:hypothetical protein